MKKAESNRIESLDAFRGVASFLIMVTHILLFVPEICQGENLLYIYGGLSWKLPYFFILSGFVLTLSYERSRATQKAPFRSFLVSRVLRIYPLFFITTVVMYLLREYFGAGEAIEGASIFLNISWQLDPTFWNLIHGLTLIGAENTWLYNGPAWTLVFEMRYAIFFPIILWVLRRNWVSIILFLSFAAVASYINGELECVDLFYYPDQFMANICSMFSFLLFYAVGILVALNREILSQIYKLSSLSSRIVFLVVILIMVVNPLWIGYLFPAEVTIFTSNCVMAFGVAMWVIVLLNDSAVSAIFSKKILVSLGRCSFSIYMWHTPITTTLYMLLHETINIWYIVVMSIVATLIVAPLSFRYIEQPIINLSRRLRQ